MLYYGAKNGIFDLRTALKECITGMRRAGILDFHFNLQDVFL